MASMNLLVAVAVMNQLVGAHLRTTGLYMSPTDHTLTLAQFRTDGTERWGIVLAASWPTGGKTLN